MFGYYKESKNMGCFLTLKMDIQNSVYLAFFVLDGIRAMCNEQVCLFLKDEGC
jgi:hypothetical protein